MVTFNQNKKLLFISTSPGRVIYTMISAASVMNEVPVVARVTPTLSTGCPKSCTGLRGNSQLPKQLRADISKHVSLQESI